MRRHACALHYVALILLVIGVLLGGTARDEAGMLTVVIGYLTMVGGGIFFFVLDRNDEAAPVESYKRQKKLNGVGLAIFVVVALLLVSCVQENVAALQEQQLLGEKVGITGLIPLDVFLLSLPYILLIVLYIPVMSRSIAYETISREFEITPENADHIVAHGGSFSPVAGARDVLKNRDHLFFEENKVFVPLDRIVEIEPREGKLFGASVDPGVTVTTEKGWKFSLSTGDYEALASGLEGYGFLFEH